MLRSSIEETASGLFLRIGLFLVILPAFTNIANAGGPWTLGKHHGYVQLGFSYIKSNELFKKDEQDKPWQLSRDVQDITLQAHGEFGFTNNFDGLATLPLKMIRTGETRYLPDPRRAVVDSFPASGMTSAGNISLGCRYRFIDRRWSVTGKLFMELPINNYEPETGLLSGFNTWSFRPVFSAGTSSYPFYFFAEAGAAIRTNDFSELLSLSGETGYGFLKGKTYLIVVVDVLKSVYNGQDLTFEDPETGMPYDPIKNGLYLNDQEYFAFGLKVNQEILETWQISAGFYGAFYGNLAAYNPSFNVGIAYGWK